MRSEGGENLQFIMNEMLYKAAMTCLAAHRGQTDKAGEEYFQHPMRVGLRGRTSEEKIVGMLHDVLEDSPISSEDLRAEGFTEEIISAVEALTRRQDETYDDFILRCSANPLARSVKLNDLADNMDVSRLRELGPSDTERLNRYIKARRMLMEASSGSCGEEVREPDEEYGPQPDVLSSCGRRRLTVTMPDGTEIYDSCDIDTFRKTIALIGIRRVGSLGLVCGRYSLVAELNFSGKYVPVEGLYLFVKMSAEEMSEILAVIGDRLGFRLKPGLK